MAPYPYPQDVGFPPPGPGRAMALALDVSSPERLGQSIQFKLTHPSPSQIETFYWIIGFFFAVLVLWHFPVLKHLLYPFKLVTVAFHEFSHAAAGKCTGAKIEAITVNPDEGGVTRMRGGRTCCVLPAGYIGSSVIGSMMIFCGFDVLASKICAVLLMLCLLATLYWAETWFTRGLTLLFIALFPVLWVVTPNGEGLRHVVLFLGVMSACYSLWDIIEDLIARKVNSSDASMFADRYGCAPQFWGIFWFLISLIFLGIAIVLALIVY